MQGLFFFFIFLKVLIFFPHLNLLAGEKLLISGLFCVFGVEGE